ncbi:MAG: EAL domain-containing protein, partial [Dehalococcoidia bacterium]|nr:EAL domain-containing protein [Dehalococcoidia bacterium]
ASQFERLDGRPYEILAIARDIRERRARETALRDQAERDPLTGLPNRTRLLAELNEMIAVAPAVPSALAMVDLDRFKEINDSLGHEAGDRVLVAVARAMANAAEHHTVGRLAGDEFVVLMRGATVGDATAIADRIRLAISHVSVPARGERIHPQASVGVATIRAQAAPQAILAAADAALYAAKEGGRNRVVIEAQLEQHRRDFGDFLLADAVFEAIADDRLDLAYEPIVRLASGEPVAHRALLRMRNPDGTVTPYEGFAGAMERVGALPTIDRCAAALVTQALQQHPSLRAVLRISASAARDSEVFTFIEEALGAHSGSGTRLLVEIAEFTGSLDNEAQRAALERLRRLGCGVSLCEPGSGYGVMNIARDVPLTAITLGEALTHSVQTSHRSRALAFAVQSLADALGIQTLADGIETAEQLAVLREIGVALGAGPLLGRPTRVPIALVTLPEPAFAEAS